MIKDRAKKYELGFSVAVEFILFIHLLDVLLLTLHRLSFRMINETLFKNHILKNL